MLGNGRKASARAARETVQGNNEFAKVGVVSSNLIARSKNSLIKSVSDTLPSVAKPFWVLGWDWGTPSLRCRFFSMRADRFRCVLCPSDDRAQGCKDLASWSPDENDAPVSRLRVWMPIGTLLDWVRDDDRGPSSVPVHSLPAP